MVYLKENNFNSTLEESEKALKINPESSLAYLLQGFVYYQKGEKEKAILSVGKAKELSKSEFISSSLAKVIQKLKK
ncbi:MAG TPA: hypothetical protein DHV62_05670 [Elusimicrobia bacterium]|nr:hypothetical protein [Elusimicrobiota bacterium]